jgi:hypothetical protein
VNNWKQLYLREYPNFEQTNFILYNRGIPFLSGKVGRHDFILISHCLFTAFIWFPFHRAILSISVTFAANTIFIHHMLTWDFVCFKHYFNYHEEWMHKTWTFTAIIICSEPDFEPVPPEFTAELSYLSVITDDCNFSKSESVDCQWHGNAFVRIHFWRYSVSEGTEK